MIQPLDQRLSSHVVKVPKRDPLSFARIMAESIKYTGMITQTVLFRNPVDLYEECVNMTRGAITRIRNQPKLGIKLANGQQLRVRVNANNRPLRL